MSLKQQIEVAGLRRLVTELEQRVKFLEECEEARRTGKRGILMNEAQRERARARMAKARAVKALRDTGMDPAKAKAEVEKRGAETVLKEAKANAGHA